MCELSSLWMYGVRAHSGDAGRQALGARADGVGRAQVYMHHYVGATTMLIESGAEMRGRMTREPVRAH